MTGKELSEGLGISQGMVSRLLKRGMPSDSIERAKRWRNRHMERPRLKGIRADTRPAPTLKQPLTGANDADKAPDLFDEDDRDDGDRAFDEFRTSRDKREHYAALTAQMDYEKACGQLMIASDVTATISRLGTEVRLSLEQWPTSLGPLLLHKTEEEIRQILDIEVERILENLSRGLAVLAFGENRNENESARP